MFGISLTSNELQHLLLEYCLLCLLQIWGKSKAMGRERKVSFWKNKAQGPDDLSSN